MYYTAANSYFLFLQLIEQQLVVHYPMKEYSVCMYNLTELFNYPRLFSYILHAVLVAVIYIVEILLACIIYCTH